MNLEDEYDLPRSRPWMKWLWALLILALIGAGSYAYATNLGGVRDALYTVRVSVRETTEGAAGEDADEAEIPADVDLATLPDPEVQDLSRRIADLELRSAILDAIDRHPELASAAVRVQVVDGDATLSGTVNTAEQREAIIQIAVREGAGSIADELELRASPAANGHGNEPLARRVEFELYSTDAFDLRRIEITAGGGEVELSGTVRSLAERLLAERIASDVAGVETVVNGLEVTVDGP